VNPLILVDGLRKRYPTRVALDGVTLSVGAGEVVGLLGPNGAGKSTTLSILATLLPFDAGSVTIAGQPLPAAAAGARRALGFVPQRLALYPTLSARENLGFFARMLGLAARQAAHSVTEVLELVGLESRADEPVHRFSGGMQRRLNLACGILHRPRVLLLDEPAVGVDPQSRERLFETVSGLAANGTAVLYSTNQMEEAERLCARVVLLDVGRVVASGTPPALVAEAGASATVRVRTARALPTGWLATDGARLVESSDGATTVAITHSGVVPAVLADVLRAGGEVLDFSLHRPTLADAFFSLTGRALRDEGESAPAAG
jgi:ABC-2 type transport system ATP-binding protein